MNGADIVCDALLAQGVDTWFANPGTSEMHLVGALDRRPEIRCVLGLAEGVVTGAADGYARMAGKPAATLLHCGPGLANGLANLHNARRAGTPIVNIVGDHATYHLRYDAPLTSDIESLARPMSAWVGRTTDIAEVASDIGAATRAATSTPGVATLIMPANIAWTEATASAPESPAPQPATFDPAAIERAAAALSQTERAVLLMSGKALTETGLAIAAGICAMTGARMLAGVANGRVERGAGRFPIDALPYLVDAAMPALAGTEVLITIGAPDPVAFFAYPGKPSLLTPEGCEIIGLAGLGDDIVAALVALADRLGAAPAEPSPPLPLPPMPEPGPLTDTALSAIIARALPVDAIVCDESITSLRQFWNMSKGAPRHDYLQLTGGAIGAGIPLAVGAAVACPGRPVFCLQADGSAMYTCQGLWTQAREQLDVVTIILANRRYAVLHMEMRNVGVDKPGPNAQRMLDLDQPAIDWVSLAQGMGVPAARADTVEAFAALLDQAKAQRGPFLIEAVI